MTGVLACNNNLRYLHGKPFSISVCITFIQYYLQFQGAVPKFQKIFYGIYESSSTTVFLNKEWIYYISCVKWDILKVYKLLVSL